MHQHIDFLIKNNRTEQAYQLLLDLKETPDLTVDETGWVLWNLSDIPAVRRKAETVYKNHKEFVAWGKQELYPHKLHWLVSDATQALTLSLGNYLDQWFDWYLYACEHSSRTEENRGVRFESHRAAAAAFLTLNELSNINVPLTNMLHLIEEDLNWDNKIFAVFTYWTFIAEKAFILNETESFTEAVENINMLNEEIKKVLDSNVSENDSGLFGSWDDLNCSRLTKLSMAVLLHNGACTFHRMGKFDESIQLFQLALENGVSITTYGLAMYLSALQKMNREDKEIVESFLIHSSEGSTLEDLFQLAPNLKNICWPNFSEKEARGII